MPRPQSVSRPRSASHGAAAFMEMNAIWVMWAIHKPHRGPHAPSAAGLSFHFESLGMSFSNLKQRSPDSGSRTLRALLGPRRACFLLAGLLCVLAWE